MIPGLLNHRFVQAFHTHGNSSRKNKKKRPHPNPGADSAVHRGGQSCCSLLLKPGLDQQSWGLKGSLLRKSKGTLQGQRIRRGRQGQDKKAGQTDKSDAGKWFKLKQAGGSKQGRTVSDAGHVGSLFCHAGKPLKSARSNASRTILAGCLS